ncbi:MAG: NHL repeat-containing protein [Proteobacteria bacterium]|nr:NHL repeat-containing protein [Pseudomonadota bacterium]
MYATSVITTISFQKRLLLTVLSATCLCASLPSRSLAIVEEEGKVGVEVIAILNTDELGERLRYPSAVMYDKEMDETYVVGGGEGKVIVYGSNFFPTVSLGKGRGADSARGVYINDSSKIYLCQSNSENKPARITSFNAAFFPEKEIVFSSMPEGEKFVPKNMVTGLSGNMYITGQNTRGLLVLDSEGNFSHWLKPMDKLITENSLVRPLEEGAEELSPDLVAMTEAVQDAAQKENSEMNMRDLLPPGLLPSIDENAATFTDQELKPVQVAHVATDSEGHLYVLSEETSKIYVYSHTEEFLFSFGQKGGSTGKMSRPKCLVVDEKKKALYVVDYMRHTILIFDLGGKFMYEFGGMGTGPGWFQYPVGLALNKQGNLIVADLFNQRVQILNIKFEYKFPMFQNPNQEQEAIPSEKELTVPDVKREEGDIFFPEPIYL